MPNVAPISKRKSDHLNINLEKDVNSNLTNGLECFRFIHEALPEINLDQVDISTNVFEKRIKAPILISSMTGGTKKAEGINRSLAEAAQECGIAMGVGSQRVAIDHPEKASSFKVAREAAPDVLLFANLGAIQLNYEYGIDECRRAVDMVQADALILHLNPLQEALQTGGNTNFSGLTKKIEIICKSLQVPVIAKEVGWGISTRTAKLLARCGISAIDVAGAGGTSWSKVEAYLAPNETSQKLADSFDTWGINTADSILNVKDSVPSMAIFASGGLKDGVDIAKVLSLGATLGGMAGPFLKTATISTEKVIEFIQLLEAQIRISMFSVSAKDITSLRRDKLRRA